MSVFLQYLCEQFDAGEQVDVIYTFGKAFDRKNHTSFRRKLDNFGISNKLAELFESYLCDRWFVKTDTKRRRIFQW